MRFIANNTNGVHLRDILPNEGHEIDQVLAAIAYGSRSQNKEMDLIGNCLKHRLRLDIWMRYDHTVPVEVSVLKRLANNHKNNIFCQLVPDYLHAKVIWWKGYGAYIGSANMSDRAWMTNIEAGVFFPETDLISSGLASELEDFFSYLRDLDVCFPLSDEVIKEMEELREARKGLLDVGKKLRQHSEWNGPQFTSKTNALDRGLESFRTEWLGTLTILRNIGKELKGNAPKWVESSVPIEWQVDQFLHSYYYNQVSDGPKKPYEDYYQLNKANPQQALLEAIRWWQSTETPPSDEEYTLYTSAPYIRDTLSKDNISKITEQEFEKICAYTHATVDHIIKISLPTMGLSEAKYLSRDERVPVFSKWIYSKQNAKGENIKGLLAYVLYGGRNEDLWHRLYLAAKSDEHRIEHYGLNSIAEVVGWAIPEVAPPRNGRTSKALRALGYDVRIY